MIYYIKEMSCMDLFYMIDYKDNSSAGDMKAPEHKHYQLSPKLLFAICPLTVPAMINHTKY